MKAFCKKEWSESDPRNKIGCGKINLIRISKTAGSLNNFKNIGSFLKDLSRCRESLTILLYRFLTRTIHIKQQQKTYRYRYHLNR